MILTDNTHMLGDYALNDYDGELLTMAHDLALRLLPAFNGTKTGDLFILLADNFTQISDELF